MDLRCQYAKRTCPNLRSVKNNGSLHRLCKVHRKKANATQRLWHSRHQGGMANQSLDNQQTPRGELQAPGDEEQKGSTLEVPEIDLETDLCDLLNEEELEEFLEFVAEMDARVESTQN